MLAELYPDKQPDYHHSQLLYHSQQLKKNIDSPLLIGSAMFGIGWALVGFCPGPVISALTQVDGNVFMFFIAMSIGMLIKKIY